MRSLSDGWSHPKGDQNHLRTIRTLLPYLWPKNAKELRLRVVTALIFLAAAKAITVGVPFIYKLAVDQISGSVEATVVVPVGLLVAYGLARVLSQTFGELRDAVFAKVAQRAIRKATLGRAVDVAAGKTCTGRPWRTRRRWRWRRRSASCC